VEDSVRQFKSVMVLILIAAAVISLLVGDLKDAIAIMAIVVLFGVLGFTQEYRAEKRWRRCARWRCPTCACGATARCARWRRRNCAGRHRAAGGGQCGAGGCAHRRKQQFADSRSRAHGRVGTIEKETGTLSGDNLPLGDRRNMASWAPTSPTARRGRRRRDGMNTELGHIATLIQEVDNEMTPLQSGSINWARCWAWWPSSSPA